MKTAVEYLEEAIKVSSKETFYDLVEVISIAKEMEKKQITDAYDISGMRSVLYDEQQGDGQDYYNYLINDFSE